MRDRARPCGFDFPTSRAALIRVVTVVVILLASPSPGRSELLVEGSRDNLVLTAQQAPLDVVVGTLGDKFGVRLKSKGPLSGAITGRFSGSLLTVLKSLLYGYDFVIALAGDDTVVTILGEANNSDIPRAGAQPAPKVRKSADGH